MSDLYEDLILLLEPGNCPQPELVARLGAVKERRDAEVKRVIGEMEKGNYEIIDLENDEY
jgi:hypothetical protein